MDMEKERLRRYKDKFELIQTRKSKIESWIKGKSVEDLEKDIKSRLAAYKAFQEITEANMDICAMMLKDTGRTVKDDYENIRKLSNQKLIPKNLEGPLKEMNGLRNRLVHEYNGLETEIALKSIRILLPEIEKFKEAASKWLKKKT